MAEERDGQRHGEVGEPTRSLAAPLIHGLELLGDLSKGRARQLRFRVPDDKGTECLVFDYCPSFDAWDGFALELSVLPRGGARPLYWVQRRLGEPPRVKLQARIYGDESPRALRIADLGTRFDVARVTIGSDPVGHNCYGGSAGSGVGAQQGKLSVRRWGQFAHPFPAS